MRLERGSCVLRPEESDIARRVFELVKIDAKGTVFSKSGVQEWCRQLDSPVRALELEQLNLNSADLQDLLAGCTPDPKTGVVSYQAFEEAFKATLRVQHEQQLAELLPDLSALTERSLDQRALKALATVGCPAARPLHVRHGHQDPTTVGYSSMREIELFVSGGGPDLASERQAIQHQVLPKVNAALASRGLRFKAVFAPCGADSALWAAEYLQGHNPWMIHLVGSRFEHVPGSVARDPGTAQGLPWGHKEGWVSQGHLEAEAAWLSRPNQPVHGFVYVRDPSFLVLAAAEEQRLFLQCDQPHKVELFLSQLAKHPSLTVRHYSCQFGAVVKHLHQQELGVLSGLAGFVDRFSRDLLEHAAHLGGPSSERVLQPSVEHTLQLAQDPPPVLCLPRDLEGCVLTVTGVPGAGASTQLAALAASAQGASHLVGPDGWSVLDMLHNLAGQLGASLPSAPKELTAGWHAALREVCKRRGRVVLVVDGLDRVRYLTRSSGRASEHWVAPGEHQHRQSEPTAPEQLLQMLLPQPVPPELFVCLSVSLGASEEPGGWQALLTRCYKEGTPLSMGGGQMLELGAPGMQAEQQTKHALQLVAARMRAQLPLPCSRSDELVLAGHEGRPVALLPELEKRFAAGQLQSKLSLLGVAAALCRENYGSPSEAPQRIVLAGPPGSGKSSLAARIHEQFGVVHVTPGELLRKAMADETQIGVQAKKHMDAGEMLPDGLVVQLVQDRLNSPDCRMGGWLLDGYPRTAAQAEALVDAGVVPEHYFLLEVSADILFDRCLHRRVDPATGAIYNLKSNPPPEDSEVLERLVQRGDDKEESIRKRLEQFEKHSCEVGLMYSDIAHPVEASRWLDQVFGSICSVLNQGQSSGYTESGLQLPAAQSSVSVTAVTLGEDEDASVEVHTAGGEVMAELRVIHLNDVYELDNFPHLVNLIKEKRTDNCIVVLGGDFLAPSLLSSMDQGYGMLDTMNHTGVDYVCFGNHEWDVGMDALQERIEGFKGKWLNTNMQGFESRSKMLEYDVLELPGKDRVRKVGLLGLLTEDPGLYRAGAWGGAAIDPVVESASKYKKLLEEEHGVDLVVPITHQIGARDIAMAELGLGFPLILAAHEHSVHTERHGPDGCAVLRAGMDAHHVVVADLVWHADKASPVVSWELLQTNKFDPDPEMQLRVKQHMRPVHEFDQMHLKVLDPARPPLSSKGMRSSQTSVGSLVCTALRKALKCDAVILNAGGIRGDTEYPVEQQTFTYASLKKEIPFESEVVVVQMAGDVLREAIEYSRRHAPVESGGFLQHDNSLTVELDQFGNHCLKAINGEALDLEAQYSVGVFYTSLKGMDNIKPLKDFYKQACLDAAARVPDEDAGVPAKVLVVQHYAKELWSTLGGKSFEELDLDHDGVISKGELQDALEKRFGGGVPGFVAENMMAAMGAKAVTKSDFEDALRQEAAAQTIQNAQRVRAAKAKVEAKRQVAAAAAGEEAAAPGDAAAEEAAAEEAAAEEAPAEEAAAADAPAEEAPAAEDAPAAGEAAAAEAPAAEDAPEEPAAGEEAATEDAPAVASEEAATEDAPATSEEAATEDAPAAGEEAPTEEAAAVASEEAAGEEAAAADSPTAGEEAPAEAPPGAENAPAEEAAAPGDAPAAEEAPAEEAGAEDAPAEEAAAAEDAPAAEEAPAEEAGAEAQGEEAPAAEDTPAAEEAPAEEAAAPAEDAPAEEAPAAEDAPAAEEAPAGEEAGAEAQGEEAAGAEAPAAEEAAGAEAPAAEEAAGAEAPAAEEAAAAEGLKNTPSFEDEFARMDKNKNGEVDRAEWLEYQKEKSEADANQDGVVDDEEWTKFQARKAAERAAAAEAEQ